MRFPFFASYFLETCKRSANRVLSVISALKLNCVFQVANEGYEGFSLAHKNMDGIRLLTMRVPGYMKDSLEILYKVPVILQIDIRTNPFNA